MTVLVLACIVGGLLILNRRKSCAFLFKWLPLPLWCYALPLIAATAGWLPHDYAVYRKMSDLLLPVALGLLLLSVDLGTVLRLGKPALAAAGIGALGILVGTTLGVAVFRHWLPADAWKGAGALSATWTGGTMNLLAIRSLLDISKEVFAPLIIVDAAVAYAWMALLVWLADRQTHLDRWLRADTLYLQSPSITPKRTASVGLSWPNPLFGIAFFIALVYATQQLAAFLPKSFLITSASGWTVLIVSTTAILGSCLPELRAIGEQTDKAGYACLYLVLAITGAQADLRALWSTPAWLLVGISAVFIHGLCLSLAGKWLCFPAGLLATASQANIGGVVSAPMVAAVYNQSLVPIGLVLAMAENALGTYLGLVAALFCRWLTRG